MTGTGKAVLSGGCQCGAIRYALSAPPLSTALCHCRMCQKATGGPFASMAEVAKDNFAWTRGQPASFRSSSVAERDFCKDCGTPLGYRLMFCDSIEILTGTFDRPDRVVPTMQYGTEARLGWTGTIANLPSKTTLQNYGPDRLAQVFSYQQPDHD